MRQLFRRLIGRYRPPPPPPPRVYPFDWATRVLAVLAAATPPPGYCLRFVLTGERTCGTVTAEIEARAWCDSRIVEPEAAIAVRAWLGDLVWPLGRCTRRVQFCPPAPVPPGSWDSPLSVIGIAAPPEAA
jgi:hypothetical protein